MPAQTLVNCTIANSGQANLEVGESVNIRLQNLIVAGSLGPALLFHGAYSQNVLDHVIIQHETDTPSNPAIIWGDPIQGSMAFGLNDVLAGRFTRSSEQSGPVRVADRPEQLFRDYASGDLRLRETSPAREFGNPTGAPEMDFERHSRLQGKAVDAGAYAYESLMPALPAWTRYE